jgi:hypothetical protein
MCNAWNHSPSCTCGWGGLAHAGRRTGGLVRLRPPPILRTVESFTNPNARCPVCDAVVFYYESPYGGKVYFDELGPPWPKHPCTSQIVARKLEFAVTGYPLKGKTYAWQADGWHPLFIEALVEVDRGVYKILGKWRGASVEWYAAQSLEKNSIFQVRMMAGVSILELSSPSLQSLRHRGTINIYKAAHELRDARAKQRRLRSKRKALPADRHVDPSVKVNLRLPKLAKPVEPSLRARIAVPTAMSLAFDRAKTKS